MRKSLWIFLIAVFVPSIVLGWLALRTAEEQKIVLEKRTSELYQHEADALATAVRGRVEEQRRQFIETVRTLLQETDPTVIAREFSVRLEEAWPHKSIGFALGADGRLVSPDAAATAVRRDWQRFSREHGDFLWGSAAAPVYNVSINSILQPEILRKQRALSDTKAGQLYSGVELTAPTPAPQAKAIEESKIEIQAPVPAPATTASAPPPPPPASAAGTRSKSDSTKFEKSKVRESDLRKATPLKGSRKELPLIDRAAKPATVSEPGAKVPANAPAASAPIVPDATPAELPESAAALSAQSATTAVRAVQPQKLDVTQQNAVVSQIFPEIAAFRGLTEGQNDGLIARFVQDKLSLVFWVRPAVAPEMIFGCVINAADLAELWASIMPPPSYSSHSAPEFVLALLDDRARPVATSPAGETARDWKHPFVASEIGDVLPHWEAAIYLMRPEQIHESAVGLRRTLTFLVVCLLSAIALGGWLVVADARRQLALAQQKTDFVSNVSHELKTPLTSIRMFSELMLGGKPETEAKAPQYLRIIMVEAERLTRLINNVLDFAKLERRQKRLDKKPLDLREVISRLWEGQELHLREHGFQTRWQSAAAPLNVIGDVDALAQILVNLISNAEKYSGEQREIELHSYSDEKEVCVSVLDRGIGVPSGSERKIFEAFYRAHDSLSSGIQGSGLGLTLARRLAREHGGDVDYRAREGGGSAFTLRLPRQESVSDLLAT